MSIMYCDMCGNKRDSDFIEFFEMAEDYMDLSKGEYICMYCNEELPENVEVR